MCAAIWRTLPLKHRSSRSVHLSSNVRGASFFKCAVCFRIYLFFKTPTMHISTSHLFYLTTFLTCPCFNHALALSTFPANTRLLARGDAINLHAMIYNTPHCTTDLFWMSSLNRDVKTYLESCQQAVRNAIHDLVRNDDRLDNLDIEHEILDRTASSHTTRSSLVLPLRYTACA